MKNPTVNIGGLKKKKKGHEISQVGGGGGSSRKFPVFSTKILLSPPSPLSPLPTINNKQTLRRSIDFPKRI